MEPDRLGTLWNCGWIQITPQPVLLRCSLPSFRAVVRWLVNMQTNSTGFSFPINMQQTPLPAQTLMDTVFGSALAQLKA
jgi:hypothetical protein